MGGPMASAQLLAANRLLAALPAADLERWRAQLEWTDMPLGQVLYLANDGAPAMEGDEHETLDLLRGIRVQKGKSTLIGSLPPAVAAELEKQWKSEFRSQQK